MSHPPLLFVYDLETLGFDPQVPLLQIACAACRFDGRSLRVISRFNRYIRPSRPIPAKIQRITGITDQVLTDERAIPEALALRYLLDWMDAVRAIVAEELGRPIVAVVAAHNGDRFDLPRLWNAILRARPGYTVDDLPFGATLDTYQICCRLTCLRHRKKKLGEVFAFVTENDPVVLPGQAHRADCDVEMTLVIMQRLLVRHLATHCRRVRDVLRTTTAGP